MLAKVRRWGNGLALRVHKKDLESAGIGEGDVVQVELVRPRENGRLDLNSLPTFEDEDRRASVRHDRYLYG
jgi:antitoxin component of MazEF toxin-antitoxin module